MPSWPGNDPPMLRATASGVICELVMRAASLLAAAGRGPARGRRSAVAAPRGQDPEQPFSLWLESAPGDAHRDEPGRRRDGIALPVVLEGLAAGVKAPAVQLDDHLLVGKQGVDLKAAHLDVALWLRQSGPGAEGQEAILQTRARDIGVVQVGAQLRCAEMVWVAGQRLCQGVQAQDLQRLTIFDRPPERTCAEPLRHVQQGAGGGGGRDAELAGAVSPLQRAGAVY